MPGPGSGFSGCMGNRSARRILLTWSGFFVHYDRPVTDRLVAESMTGVRVLFASAFFAYAVYLTLDIIGGYVLLAALRFAVMVLCLWQIFAVPRIGGGTGTRARLTALSLAVLFILEVETQMRAPDVPFLDPSGWFVNIIFMVINAIFFLGRPHVFVGYWFCLILYYIVRGLLLVDQLTMPVFTVWFYHTLSWQLTSVLHVWWFRIRYESAVRDDRALQEQKERITLERELARIQEREILYGDMHDHLGAALVDLHQKLKRFSLKQGVQSDDMNALASQAQAIIGMLKSRILASEDEALLVSDFLLGLRMVLLRRYNNAGREVFLAMDPELEVCGCLNRPSPARNDLFAIVQELVNNDLKYGEGLSSWDMRSGEGQIILELRTNSILGSSQKSGRGSQTLIRRIESLGGEFRAQLISGRYHFLATIPCPSSGQ